MNLLIYGLQRSGTNFIETLIKKRYQVNFLNNTKDRSSLLHKHCRLYKDKEIIPEPKYNNNIVLDTFDQFESLLNVIPDYYIIVSKDPYSWYLSYRAWADKCNWPNVRHHYIEEYNLFYKTFLDFSIQSNKFIFVRYIDFINDINAQLNELEKKMKLKVKLLSRLRSSNIKKVSQSSVFTESKRAYYLNEEYLNKFNKEDIQKLDELLDPQVVSGLGYESRGSLY